MERKTYYLVIEGMIGAVSTKNPGKVVKELNVTQMEMLNNGGLIKIDNKYITTDVIKANKVRVITHKDTQDKAAKQSKSVYAVTNKVSGWEISTAKLESIEAIKDAHTFNTLIEAQTFQQYMNTEYNVTRL